MGDIKIFDYSPKALFYSCIFLLLINAKQLDASEKDIKENSAFTPGFLYIGEFVNNFKGGIKTGGTYLGLIDLSLNFDIEKSGLWKGGELYFQLEHTHGGTPSADLVGDFQVFSNIENGNFTYLYEFWYKHTLNNLSFQTGVIDLNADFLTSENGGIYANSSFGIMPAVSMNIPVPIFPKNALGFIAAYKINEKFSVQSSIFDGDPACLDDQKYGLDLKLASEQGLLSVTELHYKNNNLNGFYKAGLAFHSGKFINIMDSTGKNGNMAFYVIVDQALIPGKVNAFFKFGRTPKDYNYICMFYGAGINLSAPINSRPNDFAGIAFGSACVSSVFIDEHTRVIHSKEIAIESTYLIQITKYLGIQPYIQYIIHPGMDVSLGNVFIGAVRLNVEF